jgi:tetratricopeptide (TPR) repeat protein
MTLLSAAASTQSFASDLLRLVPDQVMRAFVQYPDVVMAFVSMALAATLIAGFWIVSGAMRASGKARMALRAQALKRVRDHRASILITRLQGGGGTLRQEMKEAIEDNFGLFAFQSEVQVDLFPLDLPTLPDTANAEKRRAVALDAAEALERSQADVIIWGRKRMLGRIELRLMTTPLPGRTHDVQSITLGWRTGRPDEGVQRALAYACARKARPVLNKPQDYKPERLQPIVEALDRMVQSPPREISDSLYLDILNDFASGALSLGERGGHMRWLQKALDARQKYLDRVDRTTDPGAWGAAQQEIGRALAALGEREGARDKLEEAVSRLKLAMDALRATDSLQHAEVALRALQRAENTLVQRHRIGLRWPV